MSTTLTNGLKLPDKGSVDWYADMQNNYAILDGAVGTVAEHTTQIAGKAPAVHTHTKSDITDFPVYGNAAGTICEGNDSRLSDARTPTSHVHGNIANDGKLTNGNRAVITGSDKAITESSVTDTELSYVAGVTSAIQTQLNAKAANADVVHKSSNEQIVGIKTFLQLMYNKESIRFSSDSFVTGTPSNNLFYAPIAIGGIANTVWNAPFIHNAAIRTTGINDYSIRVYSQISNTLTGVVAETNADASDTSFRPIVNKTHNLGTSSYQWKSFNGVNPGALSLPDISGADPIDFSQWDVSGAVWTNFYTPSENGWLRIAITDRATNSIHVFNSNDISASAYGNGAQSTGGTSRLVLLMPVLSGVRYVIIITANSISDVGKAEFIPCKGNV